MSQTNNTVLNGSDLIVSIDGVAIAYSTSCKIDTSAETGERLTKESASGKWKSKYVKGFSESISADGVVLKDGSSAMPSYDQLKEKMLAAEPVELKYNIREGDTREGKSAGGYSGEFIITSLSIDGKAGDDSTYSISFENSGQVTKNANGLTAAAA